MYFVKVVSVFCAFFSLCAASTENPKQFEDITAGDYLYERLVDLGFDQKIILIQ
jgi:hypothetical protein